MPPAKGSLTVWAGTAPDAPGETCIIRLVGCGDRVRSGSPERNNPSKSTWGSRRRPIKIRRGGNTLKRVARWQHIAVRRVDQTRQLLNAWCSPPPTIARTCLRTESERERPVRQCTATGRALPHQTGLAIQHRRVAPVRQDDESLGRRDLLIPRRVGVIRSVLEGLRVRRRAGECR